MVIIPTASKSLARRTVLVADDEPMFQIIMARVITQLGFLPILVDNGIAAIDLAETRGSELACVILDMRMPGGNGIDAAHVIQQIEPDLPIVLVSAGLPNVAAGKISRLRFVGVLEKPFTISRLSWLILLAVHGRKAAEKRLPASIHQLENRSEHS